MNTVTEEVAVQKVAPVKFVTPSNPMFPNIGLSGTSFLPEIPSARIPIPTVLETDTVSTITVVKSITPVIAGHMNLWISCRFSDIIEYSMDSVTYEKYMAETVPTE